MPPSRPDTSGKKILSRKAPGARPVVLDMQFQCQAITVLAERHLALDARAQDDLRASPARALDERLGGVADDVEHRLDELLAVAAEVGHAGVVVAHHHEPARELGQEQARTRSHTSWMLTGHDVGRRCGVSRRSMSGCSRSASLMMTWVYSRAGRLELALEKLRRAADAAERVLDLVREVADQLAVASVAQQRAPRAPGAGADRSRRARPRRCASRRLVDGHVHRQHLAVACRRRALQRRLDIKLRENLEIHPIR